MIKPAQSKYNSLIFAFKKKNGGIQIMHDIWALNAETHINKYCMRDVSIVLEKQEDPDAYFSQLWSW